MLDYYYCYCYCYCCCCCYCYYYCYRCCYHSLPQASDNPRPVLDEARVLLAEGGPRRFYRGFGVKCGFVALNGAIFNTVYVAVRRVLGVDHR